MRCCTSKVVLLRYKLFVLVLFRFTDGIKVLQPSAITAMQTQKIGYYPALRLYAMTWKKALLIRIMTLGVWLMFLFLLLRESGFW